MSKAKLHCIYIICTLSLAGCIPPKEPRILGLNARAQYLQRMQHWHLVGRTSINDSQQTIQASFTWRQNAQKYDIDFYSPFSSQSLTVNGEGTAFQAISKPTNTAQEITLETSLPFAQLSFWLKGIPYPNTTAQNLIYDNQHQLKNLQQDGWLIEFQSYADSDPISLPEKLSITNGQIKVKIQIKNWNN